MEKRKESLRNKRLCRFCLKDDEPLASIFHRTVRSKNSAPLPLQIMACLSIEVSPLDGMPSYICQVCRYFMDQSYRFKQICRQGDEALRHFIVHGELRPPIPWPQDMIKNVPDELLESSNVQVATEEELTEEEEEIDVPFDVTEMEKMKQKKQSKQKTPSRRSIKKEVNDSTVVQSTSYLLPEDEDNMQTEQVLYSSSGAPQAFPCDQCHHSFPLKQLLELHQKNHRRKRSHQCPLCSKSFFSKYDLQCHILIHSDMKPYDCVVCKKKFGRLSLLRRHEKVHRTVTKYLCTVCNSEFLTSASLEEHTLRKHNADRPYKCQQCDKCFAFKQGLERHAISHGAVLPHKCNYCPESFMVPNMLQRHVLQKHAGDRPYLCKFCPKSFLLSHHYTRHLKSKHVGEVVEDPIRKRLPKSENIVKMEQEQEQFKCVQCNASFYKQDDLIFHSAVHATQDLTCPLCKEIFEDVDEVVVHIKSHIEGEQFVCERCELVFTSEEKLDHHIDTQHKDAQEVDISYLEGKVMYETGEEIEVPLIQGEGQQGAEEGGEEEEEDLEAEYLDEEELEGEEEVEVKCVPVEGGAARQDQGGDGSVEIGGVVMEWAPVTTPGNTEASGMQELMVVGGGETIVYQLANQQHTTSNVPPSASGVSIELQLPEATIAAQAVSPKLLTPVKDDSPRPVYAELKTVDHPLYSAASIVDQENQATLQKTPAKQHAPAVQENKAEKPQETKALSSILQKAEEVKKQKKRLEEIKMKARMKLQADATTSAVKRKLSADDVADDEDYDWGITPSKKTSKKADDSPTKKQNNAAETKPDEIREKFDKKCGKKYVQKMLSFSKKSAEDEKVSKETTPAPSDVKKSSESSVKKTPEAKQRKEEPEGKPETPARSGEKSLMMLERDIMELKKNASQKSGTPGNNSSRFISSKQSRLSTSLSPSNNSSLRTFSQLKRNDATNKKTSPQKETEIKKLSGDGSLSRSSKSHPSPTKSSQDTKQQSSQKNVGNAKKVDSSSKISSREPSSTSADSAASPRRSRRASKIKDYAAMIRDSTKVGSDDEEEEETDAVNVPENVTRTSDFDTMPDDSDDDIDINEEVLIHRSTPAPKSKVKVPGRKRGRPRKHPTPGEDAGETNATTPKKNKEPSLEEAVADTSNAKSPEEDTPAKRRRGRPSKMQQETETPKTDATPTTSKLQKVQKPSSSDASPQSGAIVVQKLEGAVHAVKQDGQRVLMSPSGQPLKKVPAQLIKSLPPGVKPLPLPSSLGGTVGQVSQMKIGPKTVRVQKILMTKSQLQAMTSQGLVQMKDGAMVLKQGVKLPTAPELLKTTPKTYSESSGVGTDGASVSDTTASQETTSSQETAGEGDPLAFQDTSIESGLAETE